MNWPWYESRTDGLFGMPYADSLPQAYVVYPPCKEWPHESRSINMPVGNARDYAKIFGGHVVLL